MEQKPNPTHHCTKEAVNHLTKTVINTTLRTYASPITQTVTAECIKISDFTIAEKKKNETKPSQKQKAERQKCKWSEEKPHPTPTESYKAEEQRPTSSFAHATYLTPIYRSIVDIRAINGKTLRDKIRSDHLRPLNGIQDIIKWTEDRRREWDARVGRMEDNRLAKIARDIRPQGVRR